ncbi:MAG: ATP-binding cassette domain-containing protein [Candidatus Bathyarchaeia archaeon]
MIDFKKLVETKNIQEILALYPVARDFFVDYNLENLPRTGPLAKVLAQANEDKLAEFGFSRADIVNQFTMFLDTMLESDVQHDKIRSITILGGRNKFGQREAACITIKAGQIISIVGSTGSGKSQLLNDIECIAQRDTPTKRQVLINGKALSDKDRFSMDGKLVAQLSQNMNFVMDLSVLEFLEMHAKSRLRENSDQIIKQCFVCANELVGEKFMSETKVTQLSGGQSRALMIADTAYLSASPIVLIDEIENAGIDWKRAVSLLANKDKIVLISTHDPLLALSADKRIVIQNGGIYKIIETSAEEKESLVHIQRLTTVLMSIRQQLRSGDIIVLKEMQDEIGENQYVAVI